MLRASEILRGLLLWPPSYEGDGREAVRVLWRACLIVYSSAEWFNLLAA
jgi:hypothetical protein